MTAAHRSSPMRQAAGALMVLSGLTTAVMSVIILLTMLLVGVGIIWAFPLLAALREMYAGMILLSGDRYDDAPMWSGLGIVAALFACNPVGVLLEAVALALLLSNPPPPAAPDPGPRAPKTPPEDLLRAFEAQVPVPDLDLDLTPEEAASGVERTVTWDGREHRVKVPDGIADGTMLRLPLKPKPLVLRVRIAPPS